jgi:hypothetical protein
VDLGGQPHRLLHADRLGFRLLGTSRFRALARTQGIMR